MSQSWVRVVGESPTLAPQPRLSPLIGPGRIHLCKVLARPSHPPSNLLQFPSQATPSRSLLHSSIAYQSVAIGKRAQHPRRVDSRLPDFDNATQLCQTIMPLDLSSIYAPQLVAVVKDDSLSPEEKFKLGRGMVLGNPGLVRVNVNHGIVQKKVASVIDKQLSSLGISGGHALVDPHSPDVDVFDTRKSFTDKGNVTLTCLGVSVAVADDGATMPLWIMLLIYLGIDPFQIKLEKKGIADNLTLIEEFLGWEDLGGTSLSPFFIYVVGKFGNGNIGKSPREYLDMVAAM